MNLTEIIQEISRRSGISQSRTGRIVREMLGSVERALSEGEDVELRRFGAFRIRERRAGRGRNPRTGEKISLPAKIVPVFRPSAHLKQRVGEPRMTSSEEGGRT